MDKPTKELLKKWDDMTFNNEHGEVRVEIAKWFQQTKEWNEHCQIRDYVSTFKLINELREKEGHLPLDLRVLRNIVTFAMLEDISNFSPAVGEIVYSCL